MIYTTIERARKIYTTVLDVFNYKKSSDTVTPLAVAKQQVAGISVNAKVCVPGAGVGTYVVALLEQGLAPENIVAVESDLTYYELGSAMFERFGVNYVLTDFTIWQPKMRFDYVIGNPPYGVNAALAIKFLNKSAELSDKIHYILPRSFRKPSILKRINRNLHIVSDEDTADETFGGKIITCYQKWELREGEERELEITYTKHPDFDFVKDKAEADVFIGRMGAGPSGKVLTENFSHYADTHFFIKTTSSTVRERLVSLAPLFYKQARASVVSVPNLSKHELITIYREQFE